MVVITYAWPIHPLARLLPAKGNTGEVFVSARGELPHFKIASLNWTRYKIYGMSENIGSDDDFGTLSFICKQFEVFAGGRWRIRGIGGQLARHLVQIWHPHI